MVQVRAKTFVAVGHETANKGEHGKNLRRDTMDANLLANMELGIHADAAPGRRTSDLVSLIESLYKASPCVLALWPQRALQLAGCGN